MKDRASVEHSSTSVAVACDKVDTRIDMHKLSSNVEDLMREIQTQNRLVQLAMEEKKEKNKLVAAQHMYLQMIFYVLLFTVVPICVGLAMY